MSLDDDLVPNISMAEDYDMTFQATVPIERQREESREAAIIATSYPVITKNAQWFVDQIALLDSRIAVLSYAKKYGVDVELAGRAFDVARDIFENKANEYSKYMGSSNE